MTTVRRLPHRNLAGGEKKLILQENGVDGSYLIDLLPVNVCKQNVTRFPYVHHFSLKKPLFTL